MLTGRDPDILVETRFLNGRIPIGFSAGSERDPASRGACNIEPGDTIASLAKLNKGHFLSRKKIRYSK